MRISTIVFGALASSTLSTAASFVSFPDDKVAVHGGALLSRQDTDCPDFDDCDCVDWGLQCLEEGDMTWVSCDNGAPQDSWPDCTTNSTANATSTAASSSSIPSSISSSTNSTRVSTSPTPSSLNATKTAASSSTSVRSTAVNTTASDSAGGFFQPSSTTSGSAASSSSSVDSASISSASAHSASLASVSSASVASVSAASVASVSSASAASAASASSAAAATATPVASCDVSYKVFYYRVVISGIKNWKSDDVQSSLQQQEKGCGAMTDWSWSPDTGSGATARFNLPPLIKKGCPGRAIGSAGGPSISC